MSNVNINADIGENVPNNNVTITNSNDPPKTVAAINMGYTNENPAVFI